jgi:hypothetical protein
MDAKQDSVSDRKKGKTERKKRELNKECGIQSKNRKMECVETKADIATIEEVSDKSILEADDGNVDKEVSDRTRTEGKKTCVACDEIDSPYMIHCDECCNWWHYSCTKIPIYHIVTLELKNNACFTCKNCSKIPEKYREFDNAEEAKVNYNDICSETISTEMKQHIKELEQSFVNAITNFKRETEDLKRKILEEQLEKKNLLIKSLQEKLKASSLENKCTECDTSKTIIKEKDEDIKRLRSSVSNIEINGEIAQNDWHKQEQFLQYKLELEKKQVQLLLKENENQREHLTKKQKTIETLEDKNSQLYEKVITERDTAYVIRERVSNSPDEVTRPQYSEVVRQPASRASVQRNPINAEDHENIPNLLIGNSNTHHVYAGKMTLGKYKMQKKISYTIDQALNFIKQDRDRGRMTVTLHILDNDLKHLEPASHAAKFKELVDTTLQVYSRAKVLISLAIPRSDSLQWASRAEEVNKLVVDEFKRNDRIDFIENSKLGRKGMANMEYYTKDAIHLNKTGIATLAKNIKGAVARMLNRTGYKTS